MTPMEKKAEKLAHKIITQYNSNSDSKPGTPPDRCPFCEIEILNPAIRKQHIGSHEIEKLQRALSERELSLSEAKGREEALKMVLNNKRITDLAFRQIADAILEPSKVTEASIVWAKDQIVKANETAKLGEGK